LTTKAIISRSYPQLSNFFFKKLGITNAPPYALIDELRAIAKKHQGGLIPPGVQEHVAGILADISDTVQSMPTVPPSFEDLAQLAIFPASVPSEGIALRTADALYVPDKSGKYADVFRERVALLALPESTPMTRILPLLESHIFKDKMRYLEEHVTKRSAPHGRHSLDFKATDLYSSRVEYIARYTIFIEPGDIADRDSMPCSIRLVYHTNKSSLERRFSILAKLRKINVITVESITTTLALGPCRVATPEDVFFEETDDKYTVFVSRTGGISGKSIDPHICKGLSRLLDVEMIPLFMCVSNNVEIVHDVLRHSDIDEIPEDDDDGQDRSWMQAFLNPNEPVVPTPATVVVPENGRRPSSPSPPTPPPHPPSPTALSVHDAQHFPPLGARGPKTPRQRTATQSSHSSANGHTYENGIGGGRQRHRSAQSSVGVSDLTQFMPQSRSPFSAGQSQGLLQPAAQLAIPGARDAGRLAAQAQALVNGHQMVPGALGNPVWPPFGNFNVPVATEESDLVGIMGEHYVRPIYPLTAAKL